MNFAKPPRWSCVAFKRDIVWRSRPAFPQPAVLRTLRHQHPARQVSSVPDSQFDGHFAVRPEGALPEEESTAAASSSSIPPGPPAPPSPLPDAALESSRLSALHARLVLPQRLPLQTLARILVHPSADANPRFNNSPFATLGSHLFNNYTSEYIISTYPRIPMAILWAAMEAYIGPKALSSVAREWGIECAAEPGCEVDPGLLQFKRLPPGTVAAETLVVKEKRARSQNVVKGNAFGEVPLEATPAGQSTGDEHPNVDTTGGVSQEHAMSSFVNALMGAIYLHAGRSTAKAFFREHIISRRLSMAELFSFTQPVRDLKKLCQREGFEPPVARFLSETGRLSRSPVFNVGIFCGNDKIGEGGGSSLPEARTRAAVAALKGWFLYSPLAARVPSSMEERNAEPWTPLLVDPGEIIV